MSTLPEPSPGSDSSSGPSPEPDPEWPKVLFVSVYPLLAGTALWVLGFFTLMGLLYSEAGYAALFVLATIAVIGGGHVWFRKILEGRNKLRPWQFPTVLSTAMSAAVVVALLPLFLSLESSLPLPVLCMGLCLLGAVTFSLVKERYRFVSALAAVLSVALMIVGISWWVAEQDRKQEQEQEREELLLEISDVPHEIAVLDSPEWEPSDISTSVVSHRVYITYEPVDPSSEADGLSLTLRTESRQELEEAQWTPLHEVCESENGDRSCEEHDGGNIVVADSSDGVGETLEARTELTEGVAASLIASIPKNSEDVPVADFPYVDMVDLAGDIRTAEPGEVEEIVSAVVD